MIRSLRVGFLSFALLPPVYMLACTGVMTPQEKLATAEAYLREHGGSASYRALAYALYEEALPELEDLSDRNRAHFGLGTIPLLDLIHAGIWGLMFPGSSANSSPPPEIPPELLFTLVDNFLRNQLQEKILAHYAPLTRDASFQFRFTRLVLPNPIPATTLPVDLSGIWDQSDLLILSGAIQIILGVWHYLKAYEGVVPFALLLLTYPAPGAFPTVPSRIPEFLYDWVSQATAGKIPWQSPTFGRLSTPEELTKSQELVLTGLNALSEGFRLSETEGTPEELALISARNTLFRLATRFNLEALLGITPDLLEPALAPFDSHLFREIAESLQASFTNPNTAFTFPTPVWELLELALTFVGKGKLPTTPGELRFPAFRLGVFYTQPIPDLKALLPLGADGRFEYESEIEPWEDRNADGVRNCDEPFEDIGVAGAPDNDDDGSPDLPAIPLGKGNNHWDEPFGLRGSATLPLLYHLNPRGIWEPPNGVVNPLYLFFPDASMGGVLVPLKGSGKNVSPDLSRSYTNPDLMRFISLIHWTLTLASAGEPCR